VTRPANASLPQRHPEEMMRTFLFWTRDANELRRKGTAHQASRLRSTIGKITNVLTIATDGSSGYERAKIISRQSKA